MLVIITLLIVLFNTCNSIPVRKKSDFFKSRSIVVDYIGTRLAQIKDKSLSNMHSNWQLES